MSTAQYLRDLLRPLGVYDLEAAFNGGELDAQGESLDGATEALEEIQRETSLVTAESWGVERVAQLFVRRPVADQPRELAAALAALLRIGGDSFTLADINDTITGCGIPALVAEVGIGQVAVSCRIRGRGGPVRVNISQEMMPLSDFLNIFGLTLQDVQNYL